MWELLSRLNTPDSADPDRQQVWGLRYVDDLILRDRDTNQNGTLDERLYALQDGNWNVIALTDPSGDVQERYAYQPYGTPKFLSPTFTPRTSSSYDQETLYAGYRHDAATGLYAVRYRMLHAALGAWLSRDPIGYKSGENLENYVLNRPLILNDSHGLQPPPSQSIYELMVPSDWLSPQLRTTNPIPGGIAQQVQIQDLFGGRVRNEYQITIPDFGSFTYKNPFEATGEDVWDTFSKNFRNRLAAPDRVFDEDWSRIFRQPVAVMEQGWIVPLNTSIPTNPFIDALKGTAKDLIDFHGKVKTTPATVGGGIIGGSSGFLAYELFGKKFYPRIGMTDSRDIAEMCIGNMKCKLGMDSTLGYDDQKKYRGLFDPKLGFHYTDPRSGIHFYLDIGLPTFGLQSDGRFTFDNTRILFDDPLNIKNYSFKAGFVREF